MPSVPMKVTNHSTASPWISTVAYRARRFSLPSNSDPMTLEVSWAMNVRAVLGFPLNGCGSGILTHFPKDCCPG